jgi:hypothetical protein
MKEQKSEFKILRYYYINEGDRQKNIEAVERELQTMGYKPRRNGIESRKEDSSFCYIITFTDGTYDFECPWEGLTNSEDRPTPQQQQVTDHTSKPSKEAREFWEMAFCSIAQSPRPLEKTLVEMADQAMAEWQKRFEQ